MLLKSLYSTCINTTNSFRVLTFSLRIKPKRLIRCKHNVWFMTLYEVCGYIMIIFTIVCIVLVWMWLSANFYVCLFRHWKLLWQLLASHCSDLHKFNSKRDWDCYKPFQDQQRTLGVHYEMRPAKEDDVIYIIFTKEDDVDIRAP